MTQHSTSMICDPQLLASRLLQRLSSQWIYFIESSQAENNRVKRVSVEMFFVPLGACLIRPRRDNGKKPGPTQCVEAYATLLQVYATAEKKWRQIRPKGTRCVPCNKMCDGTHESTAEHNRRLKERKWYRGLELAAAIRLKKCGNDERRISDYLQTLQNATITATWTRASSSS